jgi:glycine betaine/choline ABC-type transport system substrate-binding protein
VRLHVDLKTAAVVVLATLTLGASVAGCGSSQGAKPTVVIGYKRTNERPSEEAVLDQIYAQALRAAGYEVKIRDVGTTEAESELAQGRISGYSEHLDTTLESFGIPPEDIPPFAQPAYAEAKAKLKTAGLTAFPPTPFSRAYGVGLLRSTANEHDLKTFSDLKGSSRQLTIVGGASCQGRGDCVGGIERSYGLTFPHYTSVEQRQRFEVLEHGESDASMVFTTDGRLAANPHRFVLLEDDRHAFPAGNVVFVTTPQFAEEAGPAFERAIVGAQRRLTLDTMRKLNAMVEVERRSPKISAATFLRAK